MRLHYEWYDENTPQLQLLAKELASREDLTAVIGGFRSSSAEVLASVLSKADKPFFTTATTEQLVRGYSAWGNLWAMAETDITQCEVLLTKVVMRGAKSVALLVKDEDLYGRTFIDWFGFQAEELGLRSCGIYTYTALPDKASAAAFASGADYVLCVPSGNDELKCLLEAYQKSDGTKRPRLIFSDTAHGTDVVRQLGMLTEGIEGVCFGSDPETGFDVSYETYFNEQPTSGAAQMYDAAMLIGYACFSQLLEPELSFRDAMRQVVDGRDLTMGSWMSGDMQLNLQAMAAGRHPDVRGASGHLNFDSKVYTNVLSTVYYNFLIYQQRYVILDYNTTDGSKRSDATLAGWNWKAQQMQEIDDEDSDDFDGKLLPLHERWALLVAASEGWSNYRHQADVLRVYQMLRSAGYDDRHIVLIAEDDLAYDASNPEPGVLRAGLSGGNIYDNVCIDYKTSQLKPDDLTDILTGNVSDRLPEVLRPDADDNVFIFWSGHGVPGALVWLDDAESFNTTAADRMLSAVEEKGCYRRLLWMVETCYSGSVAKVADNHKRMLCFTAANGDETSKTDTFSMLLGVWMSNRFTATLLDCLAADASISMRDLYYRLFQNTVGSHVCVFGADGYGNLYKNNMGEFVDENVQPPKTN